MDLDQHDKKRLWQLLNKKEHVAKPVATIVAILALGGVLGSLAWNRIAEYREKEWLLAVSPLTRWCHDYQNGVTGKVPDPASIGLEELDQSLGECLCLSSPLYRLKLMTHMEKGWQAHYQALLKRSDFVETRMLQMDQGIKVVLPGGALLPVGFNNPQEPRERDLLAWFHQYEQWQAAGAKGAAPKRPSPARKPDSNQGNCRGLN